MKKTYQSPIINIVKISITKNLLTPLSGGVQTGGAPGNEYNGTDVSYSRKEIGLWDDYEEE